MSVAGKPNLQPVNVAIGTHDETRPFFYVRESDDADLPDWYDQIGSFSREQLLQPAHRERIPNLEERVVATEVSVLSFASLWHTHELPHLDVLAIDAEGHDDEILASVHSAGYGRDSCSSSTSISMIIAGTRRGASSALTAMT